MISVDLYTPKGVYKGLYHYERVSAIKVKCWKDGTDPENGYDLTWYGAGWMCNCKGYAIRRTCTHARDCPYSGKMEFVDDGIGPLERGARNAWVRLADGRKVNCYDHFWIQKPGKGALK